MKKNIYLIIVIFLAAMLVQCDLIIGSGENVNVSIDLADFWAGGSGRAIQLVPDGTTCTGIRVSVFGEGMQPMQKSVSPGTRYVNLYVPAGMDRHFTLESYFSITNQQLFPYLHMRSFKGRASADLKPGTTIKLKFRMVAGATTLLVEDYMQDRIWEGENITFSSPTFGAAPFISDIDIASDGRIVGTINDTFNPTSSIQIGQYISGFVTYFNTPSRAYALAMDRDIHINI